MLQGLPNGSVVKTAFQCKAVDSIPGAELSPMPWDRNQTINNRNNIATKFNKGFKFC